MLKVSHLDIQTINMVVKKQLDIHFLPKWSNRHQIYLPNRNNQKLDKTYITIVFKTLDMCDKRW